MNQHQNPNSQLIEKVKSNLEGQGLFVTIVDVKESIVDATYKVSVSDGNYAKTIEFAASKLMIFDQFEQTIEIMTSRFHYDFERDKEFFIAMQSYKGLSNDAKAAFSIACLNFGSTFDYRDRAIAKELNDTGLFDSGQFAEDVTLYGYTLRPKSLAMQVWSSLKGKA